MSMYRETDEEIIAVVKSGTVKFHAIFDKLGLPPRMVDRRLQALRKKGRLIFDSKRGWSAPEPSDINESAR